MGTLFGVKLAREKIRSHGEAYLTSVSVRDLAFGSVHSVI